jgi:hypothetical protein
MNTSADVSKFKISPFLFKSCILLKPVLGGVDGNLHIPVPSMNRLNQTEPATFINFAVFIGLSLEILFFPYFIVSQSISAYHSAAVNMY